MTSLEPTSRWAILPSGETLDLVRPGMSSVVGRNRGVDVAELLRVRVLCVSATANREERVATGHILSRAPWMRRQRRVAQGAADAVLAHGLAMVAVVGVQRQRLELTIVRREFLDCLHALGRGGGNGGRRRGGACGLGVVFVRVVVSRLGEFAHEEVSGVDGVAAEAAGCGRGGCRGAAAVRVVQLCLCSWRGHSRRWDGHPIVEQSGRGPGRASRRYQAQIDGAGQCAGRSLLRLLVMDGQEARDSGRADQAASVAYSPPCMQRSDR